MAKIPEILIQSNFTRIKIRIISFFFLNINEKLITLILGYKNRFEGYYGNAFFRNICVMFKTVISNTRRYIVVVFFFGISKLDGRMSAEACVERFGAWRSELLL